VHAACWAHARRKFFDAVKLNPKDQTSIRIVAQLDELFAIDAQARQEGLSQIDRHVSAFGEKQAAAGADQGGNPGSTWQCAAQERSGQGLRLHADALDPAQSFPGISRVGTLQQPGRERDAPGSSWSEKLDTRRK
jgi:Transposase IS66 family